MSQTMKRTFILIPMLLLLAALLPMGAKTAEASEYYYFKSPEVGATYTVGDKIPVSFYAGVVIKQTRMDAWGRPAETTYETMPASFKVFKGSKELYSEDFTYTNGTTLETTYTPSTKGTLKLCIYGKDMGLNVTAQTLQATITIKVKAKKPSAVKKMKPAITVDRTAKKEATITCDNSMGFGMKIYRSNKKNGTYKLVKTTSKDTYVDKKLSAKKKYYYKVRLYAKSGKKVYLSKWSAKALAGKFKPGVTVKFVAGKGVKVSWQKVNAADYYLVCRNTKGTGSEYDVISCESKTATSYLDKDVKPGKTYYYALIAQKGDDDIVKKFFNNSAKVKVPKSFKTQSLKAQSIS